MIFIKMMELIGIFIGISTVGVLISNKYRDRVKELKEIKKALNMFETKIKFTYEPIPEIFQDISDNLIDNIAYMFRQASNTMQQKSARQAWEEALESSNFNITKEDIDILKGFGKLLGKTDMQGQLNQIQLTTNFVDIQIIKAEKEYEKNAKLYKTLSLVTGLALVIILI